MKELFRFEPTPYRIYSTEEENDLIDWIGEAQTEKYEAEQERKRERKRKKLQKANRERCSCMCM